jgi:hypothetical protein
VSIYLVNQREILAEKFKLKGSQDFTPSEPTKENSLELSVEIHEVETSQSASLHPKM